MLHWRILLLLPQTKCLETSLQTCQGDRQAISIGIVNIQLLYNKKIWQKCPYKGRQQEDSAPQKPPLFFFCTLWKDFADFFSLFQPGSLFSDFIRFRKAATWNPHKAHCHKITCHMQLMILLCLNRVAPFIVIWHEQNGCAHRLDKYKIRKRRPLCCQKCMYNVQYESIMMNFKMQCALAHYCNRGCANNCQSYWAKEGEGFFLK